MTAVVEAATGLALLLSPALIAALLLGGSLDSPASLVVGRVAGAALLALGAACWLARDGEPSAARRLIAAMLLYDVGAAAVLVYAGIGLGLFSVLLWPVVVLHTALAVWCIACLRSTPQNAGEKNQQ